MDLINLIKNISDDNIPYKYSELIHISHIKREHLEFFFKNWYKISKPRKIDLLKKFILLSEENLDLDYSPIFIKLLKDNDHQVKQLALEGLWEYEDREIIDPVISLLNQNYPNEVRVSAVALLGIFITNALDNKVIKRDAEKIVANLKLIFKSDENLNIRKKVLESLSPYEDEEINSFIYEAYESNDIEFKKSGIFSMGETYKEKWLPQILYELQSPHPSIRFEAVNAYSKLCNSNKISEIAKLIKDDDNEVRLAAINAIGIIGGPSSKSFLRKISKDSDSVSTEAAKEILKNIESEENNSLFAPLEINPKESM